MSDCRHPSPFPEEPRRLGECQPEEPPDVEGGEEGHAADQDAGGRGGGGGGQGRHLGWHSPAAEEEHR